MAYLPGLSIKSSIYFTVTGKGRLVVAEEAKKHVETNIRTVAGRFRPDLPSYSMEEVSKHTTKYVK